MREEEENMDFEIKKRKKARDETCMDCRKESSLRLKESKKTRRSANFNGKN